MRFKELLGWYGKYGLLRLTADLLWTRLMFANARLIRRPFYIRGAARIVFGHGFTSGPGLRIDALGPAAKVNVGVDVQVNNNVHIAALDCVTIGDRVLIASGVFIADHGHGSYSGMEQSDPTVAPVKRPLRSAPVTIGEDTWLGEHVCVLSGVSIGRGVVVGAGAVVTRDLPDYVVAVGSPARVIKRFDFASQRWIPSR
jgi:lipopolysaccharide O-acetyltransferase